MQQPATQTPLIRGLLVRLVAPAGGGLMIAGSTWAGGMSSGLTAAAAVAVVTVIYQLREQRRAAERQAEHLAAAEHPWSAQLRRLARRAGLPTPPLYMDPSWGTMAGTVGHVPREMGIVVEGGVMRALSLTGAAGLLAHELGHIAGDHVRHALLERAALQSLARLAQLCGFAILFTSGLPAPAAVVAFVVAWLVPMRIAELIAAFSLRRKELAADRYAAALVGSPVAARSLREYDDYVDAQREWANAVFQAQNPSLWARLARGLHRSPDASVLLAAMERLEEATDRAVALIDAPPPTSAELRSHSRRLRRLLGNLPVKRGHALPARRADGGWLMTAPLRAGWTELISDHPSTAERLRQLGLR